MNKRYKRTSVKSKKHLIRSLNTFTEQYNYVYCVEDIERLEKLKNYEILLESKKSSLRTKEINEAQNEVENYKRTRFKTFESVKSEYPDTFRYKLERKLNTTINTINNEILFTKFEYKNTLPTHHLFSYYENYNNKNSGDSNTYFSYYRKKKYNLNNKEMTLEFSDELISFISPTFTYAPTPLFDKDMAIEDLKNIKIIEETIPKMLNMQKDNYLQALLKLMVYKFKENTFFDDEEDVIDFLIEKSNDLSRTYAKRLYSQLKNRIKYKNFGIYSESYETKRKQTIEPEYNFMSLYIKDMFEFIKLRNYLTTILTKEATIKYKNFNDSKEFTMDMHKDTLLNEHYLNLLQYHILFEKVLLFQKFCYFTKKLLEEYKGKKNYNSIFNLDEIKEYFKIDNIGYEIKYIEFLILSTLKDKELISFIHRITEINFFNLTIKEFILIFLELFYNKKNKQHIINDIEYRVNKVAIY